MIYQASLQERIDDKLAGVVFIHNKDELDHHVLNINQVSTIKIDEGFASKFFTPHALKEYMSEVSRMNPFIKFDVDDIKTVNNVGEFGLVKKMLRATNIRDLDEIILHDPKLSMAVIQNLCKNYSDSINIDLNYNSRISTLQAEVAELHEDLDEKDQQIVDSKGLILDYQNRLHNLISRINYTYGKNILDKNIFHVDTNQYDCVLYFKEITRVQHFDTFIHYLQQILTVMYEMPVRLTVIEPYYADGKVSQYPNLIPHNQVTEHNIINDDILQLGFQPKIMEAIMRNPRKVSFLIIVDRSGYARPFLTGSKIEYFYVASDKKDIPENVPLSRVISYDKDTLFIQYDRDFDSWDSSSKMQFYSSMNTMKVILKLVG